MHDWTSADERFAKALAAKGYHYQFIFARNARHVDKAVVAQTLPEAIEWLWKGYLIPLSSVAMTSGACTRQAACVLPAPTPY